MIRIVLVDDHKVVRQGLHSFLSGIAEFELVGEGATGQSAIELALNKQPDILLLDMLLPDMTGLDVLQAMQKKTPTTKVIILSSFSDAKLAIPTIQAGARGYLLKDIHPKDLIQAIKDVHANQMRLHPDIAALLVNELNNAQQENDIQKKHGITDRESEVLQLIGQGLTNQRIADTLHISQLTVKTHVTHILDKLALTDRTQVAIFAIRNGLAD